MEISVSVRNFVEFLLRSGDIDNRHTVNVEEAMQEGSRVHRMLQRRAGSDYEAEVPLRYSYDAGEYQIIVEGRADGIIGGLTAKALQSEIWLTEADVNRLIQVDPTMEQSENPFFLSLIKSESSARLQQESQEVLLEIPPVVDEIKGMYRDVMKMKEPVPVHLAQAKCYALFYATDHELQLIRVRMTYVNLDTEEIRYFFYEYTRQELLEWFNELAEAYRKWTDYQFEWQRLRTESIKSLDFPYPYREGQRDLITYVYRTILNRRKLFLEAPTGVGKTISTVFPAVKAMGENHLEKIFYLTAKTITRTVAEDTFALLRASGLRFKTVILTAKEKICFQEVMECNPDACPYAKGHFDRINDAIYDLLIHEESFTRELVESYARKHEVCPFEMCLDMSLFADGVIGDYNYVFDPHVYLRRFFAEGVRRDYLFLVDEAHNLLERGRSMYSAVLRKEDFMTLRKSVLTAEPKIARALSKCNKEFLALKKSSTGCDVLLSIDPLVVALNRLASTIDKFLDEKKESPVHDEVLEFYFELSHFMLIYDKLDEHYVIYSELESDGSFIVKLFCVDPSQNLQECMGRGRSSILFSATLLPIQYYKGLLGGTEDDYEVYAESVFDPGKRLLLVANDVTSKYTRRGQQEYLRIASYIKEISRAKQGNYMVFFPSHAFLQSVKEVYETYMADGTEEIVCQEEYMNEEEREAFLKQFDDRSRAELPEAADDGAFLPDADTAASDEDPDEPDHAAGTLLGFCVLGGIFSEGIDLAGEKLIGAVIVGTGLPQVCNERELMSVFFKEENKDGFQYAYQYPGMNKVAQAAGRVIRTVNDEGIVALLDERFLQNSYLRMFPKEWANYHKTSIMQVKNDVERFWQEKAKTMNL